MFGFIRKLFRPSMATIQRRRAFKRDARCIRHAALWVARRECDALKLKIQILIVALERAMHRKQ